MDHESHRYQPATWDGIRSFLNIQLKSRFLPNLIPETWKKKLTESYAEKEM